MQLDSRELVTRLDRLKGALPRVIAGAVFEVAQEAMTESKALVPVDTGVLRATGYVAPPEIGNGTASVEVGYNTPYAARVHEDLTANHPNGGQAKYLETALQPRRIRGRIVTRIKRGMEAVNG